MLQIVKLAALYVRWELYEPFSLRLGKCSPVPIGSQCRSGSFADRTTLLLSLITDWYRTFQPVASSRSRLRYPDCLKEINTIKYLCTRTDNFPFSRKIYLYLLTKECRLYRGRGAEAPCITDLDIAKDHWLALHCDSFWVQGQCGGSCEETS